MARGWESKSIESQQADRETRDRPAAPLSEAEAARLSHRRTLELARTRALMDLAAATAPAHRRTLEAAIQALDEQLQRLDNGGSDSHCVSFSRPYVAAPAPTTVYMEVQRSLTASRDRGRFRKGTGTVPLWESTGPFLARSHRATHERSGRD